MGSNGSDSRALAPRVRPTQRRAVATLDHILDVAGDLLAEGGIDSFNTNRLSERAEVAVRSVYRYFPNKLAVIVALAKRDWAPWYKVFDAVLEEISDPRRSMLDAWDRFLDGWAAVFFEAPNAWAIRRAFLVEPGLRLLDRDEDSDNSQKLASALQARGTQLPERAQQLICRILLETADATFDQALRFEGRISPELCQELKRMHRSYLAQYAD